MKNSLQTFKSLLAGILLIALTALSNNVFAQVTPKTFTSTLNGATGNWSDPITWGLTGPAVMGSTYPGPADNVIIGNDDDVVADQDIFCKRLDINYDTKAKTNSSLSMGHYTLTADIIYITGGPSANGAASSKAATLGFDAPTPLPGGAQEIGTLSIANLEGPNAIPINVILSPNANSNFIRNQANIIYRGLGTLPVSLTSFKAVKNTAGVSLIWETASEKNNAGFEVQSSVDGKNYEAIGFVASRNGTSSSVQRYAFSDKAAGKEGLVYYRLKQIDLDGAFEFFTAKVVDLGRTGTAVIAYPNPFQNQFSINLNATIAETATITVTDMTGKTVYAATASLHKGTNSLNVELKDQPAGIYILNAATGNQNYINRLVKQ